MIPALAVALTLALPAELRWAGDAEGGAPFVEADPSRPDQVIGFDVEVAALMAQGLGRTVRGSLSGDIGAARRRGTPARTALEIFVVSGCRRH